MIKNENCNKNNEEKKQILKTCMKLDTSEVALSRKYGLKFHLNENNNLKKMSKKVNLIFLENLIKKIRKI